MDILKNIEKNILNINMYDKTAEPAKLSKIKKLVGDYFKYKEDERIAVSQKIMKYDEQFKNVRERNNVEYELFLEKKGELYDIYKKNKALSSLYDYLNYKYTNSHQDTPDIYTYEYFNFNERIAVPKKPKAADAADEVPKKKPKEPKEPKEPKVPKEPKEPKVPKVPKEPKEPKVPKKKPKEPKEPKVPKEPKEPKVPKKKPKEPKEPKVPKEPKEPKEPKVPKEPKAPKVLKDCPEGQVRNPKTNRCIKEANYKKK